MRCSTETSVDPDRRRHADRTIESAEGDAALPRREAANIYDVATTGDNGMTAYVIGKDVTLIANGAIGTVTDFLEIDSSQIAAGEVTVSAGTSVFLTETSGDLNLDGALAKDGDVSITVRSGSIFDVEPDSDPIAADFMRADIQASRIDLQVSGGGIGTPTNDLEFHGGGVDQLIDPGLEIDPYHRPAAGRLWVEADESIYLMEVSGALIILAATSAAAMCGSASAIPPRRPKLSTCPAPAVRRSSAPRCRSGGSTRLVR
jgi:hypothetical protein